MTATGPVRRTEVGRVGRQKAVRVIAAVVMVGLAPAMAATSASAADRAPADGLISPTASAQPSPGSTSSAPATASSAASTATGGSTTPATASSAAPAATVGSSASPAAGQSDGTSTSPSPSASVPPAPTGQGLSDNELADLQAEHLMAGPDAKKVFGTLRAQYALHGREKDLREIQRQVALKRIKHEDEPTDNAAANAAASTTAAQPNTP